MLIPMDFGDRRPEMMEDIADIFRGGGVYSHQYHNWEWGCKRHPYGAEYVWSLRQLALRLGDFSGKKIMDGGGGRGAVQAYLAMRGANVVNVTRGGDCLRGLTGSGRTIPPIAAVSGDMADVPLPLSSFDAITSVSAIEHNPWEHILRIFVHLVDLLKPGAPLVVTVPAGEKRAWYPLGKAPYPGGSQYPPLYLFDPDALQDITDAVKDRARLDWGLPCPNYVQQWKEAMSIQMGDPTNHKVPYLSAGFVFVKK